MPNYLSTELGVNKTESFISGAISLAFYIGIVFMMGKYSDRMGRNKMLAMACIGFIILTFPLFYFLSDTSFIGMIIIQLVFCSLLAMNDGSLPAYLTELFLCMCVIPVLHLVLIQRMHCWAVRFHYLQHG